MNYSGLSTCDVANGDGVRVSLYVSGCEHHCDGCFNPETWDYAAGSKFTIEVLERIIAALAPSHVAGLTLLGGDPLAPKNQKEILNLITIVKDIYPDKTIWCYTGYTFEELFVQTNSYINDILPLLDVLVDGRFDKDLKDLGLRFRGSSNQRIILLKEKAKDE